MFDVFLTDPEIKSANNNNDTHHHKPITNINIRNETDNRSYNDRIKTAKQRNRRKDGRAIMTFDVAIEIIGENRVAYVAGSIIHDIEQHREYRMEYCRHQKPKCCR